MHIDSLLLEPEGSVTNLKFPSGTQFPASPIQGHLFRLTAVFGAYQPGNYQYVGSTWTAIAATPTVPYDIATSVFGKPAASEVVLRCPAPRAFSVTGAYARAITAGSGSSTVFTVAKNGTSIGTITFAAGATGSTSTVGATSFAVNDVLTITAPATQNAALADIDFNIKATV